MAKSFGVSNEVATVAVTVFVIGLGTGPMLAGPLAAVLGQRIIYISSFVLLFAFTWPVAFSHESVDPVDGSSVVGAAKAISSKVRSTAYGILV